MSPATPSPTGFSRIRARLAGDSVISHAGVEVAVTNVLIRGLSDAAIERIDAEAAALGLSRNEFLRRRLETEASAPVVGTVTVDDWRRSAAIFGDLADPEIMDAAWR